MSEDLRDQLVTAGTELLTKIVMQELSGDTSELYLQCEQLVNAAESVKDSTHQQALRDFLTKINEQASITKENLETFRNVLNKYGTIEIQAIVANAPEPVEIEAEVESSTSPEMTYEDYIEYEEYIEKGDFHETSAHFEDVQTELQHLAHDFEKRPDGEPIANSLLEISEEAGKIVAALPKDSKAVEPINKLSGTLQETIELATHPSKKEC